MNVSSNRFISYRGAVALNNIGVSLMESGHCQSAITIFKDALTVIRLCNILGGNVTATRVVAWATRWIDEKLSIARTIMFLVAHGAEAPIQNQMILLCYHCGQGVTVLPRTPLREITSISPTASFPVRMEVEDFNTDDPSEEELAISLSIILHNIGAANIHKTALRREGVPLTREFYPEIACSVRALGLAQLVLGSIQFNATSFESAGTAPLADHVISAMQLEAVVIQSLNPLLQLVGDMANSHACNVRLSALINSLEPRFAIDRVGGPKSAAAA